MAQNSLLVPSSLEEVERAVLRFRSLESCIKKNIPELIIRLLETLFAAFRSGELSPAVCLVLLAHVFSRFFSPLSIQRSSIRK